MFDILTLLSLKTSIVPGTAASGTPLPEELLKCLPVVHTTSLTHNNVCSPRRGGGKSPAAECRRGMSYSAKQWKQTRLRSARDNEDRLGHRAKPWPASGKGPATPQIGQLRTENDCAWTHCLRCRESQSWSGCLWWVFRPRRQLIDPLGLTDTSSWSCGTACGQTW